MKTITLKTSVIPVIKRLKGTPEEQIAQFQKDFEESWQTAKKYKNSGLVLRVGNPTPDEVASLETFLSFFCDLEPIKQAYKKSKSTSGEPYEDILQGRETYEDILRKISTAIIGEAYKSTKPQPKMYKNLRIDDAGY